MDRIQKVSRLFLIVLKFLLVVLPLQAILKWIYIDTIFLPDSISNILADLFFTDSYSGKLLVDVTWSPLAKVIGLSAYFIELLPILISLIALIHVFKNYLKGEIFSGINARYFRQIGWMFIFYGLVSKTFHDSLMTVATTLNNAPGERQISLGFGSPNLEALFCGAVVIMISWVMLEASKLHEDQKYIV